MTDGTPKPSNYQPGFQSQKRAGNKQVSLISIGQIRDQNSQIRDQNSIMKNSNKPEGQESDGSSFIDKSFENALKEAKKNVINIFCDNSVLTVFRKPNLIT